MLGTARKCSETVENGRRLWRLFSLFSFVTQLKVFDNHFELRDLDLQYRKNRYRDEKKNEYIHEWKK